ASSSWAGSGCSVPAAGCCRTAALGVRGGCAASFWQGTKPARIAKAQVAFVSKPSGTRKGTVLSPTATAPRSAQAGEGRLWPGRPLGRAGRGQSRSIGPAYLATFLVAETFHRLIFLYLLTDTSVFPSAVNASCLMCPLLPMTPGVGPSPARVPSALP